MDTTITQTITSKQEESEIFKTIPGYEGYYKITSKQRLRSSKSFRYLKFHADPDGYMRVVIEYCGKRVTHRRHRLMAEAFVPNPDNLPCVNHKNGIKHDDRPENLEWVTYSENNKHAYRTGLKSNAGINHSHKRTVLNTETGIYYEVAKEAAFVADIRPASFTRMLSGVRKNKTSFCYVD